MSELSFNPSNVLYKWFGMDERIALEIIYGIGGEKVFRDYNKLIRKFFNDYCASLL